MDEQSVDMKSPSSNGFEKIEFEDIEIPMPWGHVSGKLWGPKDVQPILALHGWQDNAASFDKLAPILAQNVGVLCIDLPGHGHSSHLHKGSFYYVFWDGLILIRRIVKHFKWDKVRPRKWWGPRGIQPIVTLHGRQDNAGSFDRLMPLLSKNIAFLCLDLPGHGNSSHLPQGQYYFVHWDGLILMRRIVRHFKWTKIRILGHSMGGAIGFLYAATYPDEVETLICLDIASPTVMNVEKAANATADGINRFLQYENLTLDSVPSYEYDEMINIVVDAYQGSITRESAEILMKRGMKPTINTGKYYFSRDPRLKVSLLGTLSTDLTKCYASKISCAYLNIRAIPGLKFEHANHYQEILDIIQKTSKRFEYQEVKGTHHVHLNEPEKMAQLILAFLEPPVVQ